MNLRRDLIRKPKKLKKMPDRPGSLHGFGILERPHRIDAVRPDSEVRMIQQLLDRAEHIPAVRPRETPDRALEGARVSPLELLDELVEREPARVPEKPADEPSVRGSRFRYFGSRMLASSSMLYATG
jgi:hypothetical protein